jgi:hypothetical protein
MVRIASAISSSFNQSANARAQADRYIDSVQIIDRAEQFVRISRNANNEVAVKRRGIFEPPLSRNSYRRLLRLVEVAPMLDQLGAE